MHSDRISQFGSRWRRHGLIEVSSRSERSRGTARAETGELFSSLRQLLCRSRSPGVHGSLRAPGATPTHEYIVFFSFALCFLFLTPQKLNSLIQKHCIQDNRQRVEHATVTFIN